MCEKPHEFILLLLLLLLRFLNEMHIFHMKKQHFHEASFWRYPDSAPCSANILTFLKKCFLRFWICGNGENIGGRSPADILTLFSRVCLCMYACMYVCVFVYVCMYVCMHVCLYARMYVCM